MNVQLENLPNCITTLRVELPAEQVSQAWDEIARNYLQHARIPGFRPGKAPRLVVESKFKKEIKEEVQRKLLTESCREAIAEKQLRVLSLADVQDVELSPDKTLRYTATLITAPVFELPEYKGLSVTVPPTDVTDEEVKEGIERLREQAADFIDVPERTLQMDDYVVIDYTGTLDGKPVHEAVSGAGKPLSGNTDFWVKMTPESFLPGFCEAIAGTAIGETREFDVEVPADFPVTELLGRKIHYAVTIKEIKTRVLPELDDAFAAKIADGKTLAEVETLAREELKRIKLHEAEGEKRNQIVKQLIAKVECELPESMLRSETQQMLSEIVRENQSRGVPDSVLKENSRELITSASETARERLKGTFILIRIAEKEGIKLEKQDVDRRLAGLAARHNIEPEKLRNDMDKAGTFDRFCEEILTGKVLDFLSSSVSISISTPEAAPEVV